MLIKRDIRDEKFSKAYPTLRQSSRSCISHQIVIFFAYFNRRQQVLHIVLSRRVLCSGRANPGHIFKTFSKAYPAIVCVGIVTNVDLLPVRVVIYGGQPPASLLFKITNSREGVTVFFLDSLHERSREIPTESTKTHIPSATMCLASCTFLVLRVCRRVLSSSILTLLPPSVQLTPWFGHHRDTFLDSTPSHSRVSLNTWSSFAFSLLAYAAVTAASRRLWTRPCETARVYQETKGVPLCGTLFARVSSRRSTIVARFARTCLTAR